VTHDQTEAMTLGDRVAILRSGTVQQVATPREIYARPANVFVAGFVDTPTMNLLAGWLEGGRLSLSQGASVQLSRPPGISGAGAVIVGIRPEVLAAPDARTGMPVIQFDARVDLVEWLGAELFVHLETEWRALTAPAALERLPVAASGNRIRLVARLDPSSPVSEGDRMRIAVGEGDLHFFDAATGARLPCNFDGGG
jgi:multiple sugar transport system ATP-binding protein